jgi:phosphatidylinositol-bisphosphatase
MYPSRFLRWKHCTDGGVPLFLPFRITLSPGLTQEIAFTLRVDNRSASALNDGAEKLEDILVLHLEKGKDIFIVVAAKWLKSPFGASIDELVLAKQPVRPSEAWVWC